MGQKVVSTLVEGIRNASKSQVIQNKAVSPVFSWQVDPRQPDKIEVEIKKLRAIAPEFLLFRPAQNEVQS